jgi:secreted trypsin-like serine protease
LPGQLPFQVLLQKCEGDAKVNCKLSCSGTIIDADTILTSAFCVRNHDAKNLKIVAGKLSIQKESLNEQVANVVKYIAHEGYKEDSLVNDIALIFVSDLQFS